MYFHVDHYGGVSQGYQSGLWSVACHTFSDRSRMSGCRWRYGSGPVGGDTHKSPPLASSCLHSLLQTSRAWTALSFSPRLASGQELHGRQEKHGAAEILAFHPHTAHLQQAFDYFQFQYELVTVCGVEMGCMSNKYPKELSLHTLGECSMNFQHKGEFY